MDEFLTVKTRDCYEAIMDMDREELEYLISAIYNKGWFDGHDGYVHDHIFGQFFLGYDESFLHADWSFLKR